MQQTLSFRHYGGHIVITGGAKGIGLETAKKFVAEGASVLISESRDPQTNIEAQNVLTAIAQETDKMIEKLIDAGFLKKQKPRIIATAPLDIEDETSVQNFFEFARIQFGSFETVVHSAGISPNTDFFDQTGAEWKHVLQTNTLWAFLVTQTALKMMQTFDIENEKSIILIGSTNGVNSNNPMSAHYDSSKAGVNLLANTVAQLYSSTHVRVNAVAPWWIDTSMNESLPSDYRETETKRIYMKRFASPSEVAETICFLASTQASYINGSVIMVDGGYN